MKKRIGRTVLTVLACLLYTSSLQAKMICSLVAAVLCAVFVFVAGLVVETCYINYYRCV